MHDKLLYLSQQDLPSACIFVKPLIHQGQGISEGELLQDSDILDTIGDVLIWGLWEQQTDAIIDVKIGDTGTDTYRFEQMDKLLYFW